MLLQRVYSATRKNPHVLNTAWWLGKTIHHSLPAITSKQNQISSISFVPSGVKTCTQESCPSYPYGATANDPLKPEPVSTSLNPVITAADITDYGDVDFVADPFLYPGSTQWHMFFEVYNMARSPPAVIGHATSENGLIWEYDRIVLDPGVHSSFPYVFGWKGDKYLIPELGGDSGTKIVLYRAKKFPTDWIPVATLVNNDHPTDDCVVFRWSDHWWAVIGDSSIAGIRIYYSDELEDNNWKPHKLNPVITGRPSGERPAGRPIIHNNHIIMFFQDCESEYGDLVRVFKITDLTKREYQDQELTISPVLEGSDDLVGWNSGNMHHIDPWYTNGQWLCAVDGNVKYQNLVTARHWSIGIYSSLPIIDNHK